LIEASVTPLSVIQSANRGHIEINDIKLITLLIGPVFDPFSLFSKVFL